MVLTWENPAAKRFHVTTSRPAFVRFGLFFTTGPKCHTLRKTNLPALNCQKPLIPRTERRTDPLTSTRTPLAAVNFSAFRQVT